MELETLLNVMPMELPRLRDSRMYSKMLGELKMATPLVHCSEWLPPPATGTSGGKSTTSRQLVALSTDGKNAGTFSSFGGGSVGGTDLLL
jgi:hypothetical protein